MFNNVAVYWSECGLLIIKECLFGKNLQSAIDVRFLCSLSENFYFPVVTDWVQHRNKLYVEAQSLCCLKLNIFRILKSSQRRHQCSCGSKPSNRWGKLIFTATTNQSVSEQKLNVEEKIFPPCLLLSASQMRRFCIQDNEPNKCEQLESEFLQQNNE